MIVIFRADGGDGNGDGDGIRVGGSGDGGVVLNRLLVRSA